jgi:hypothetical protein
MTRSSLSVPRVVNFFVLVRPFILMKSITIRDDRHRLPLSEGGSSCPSI